MSDTTDCDEQDNCNPIHHSDSPKTKLKRQSCSSRTPFPIIIPYILLPRLLDAGAEWRLNQSEEGMTKGDTRTLPPQRNPAFLKEPINGLCPQLSAWYNTKTRDTGAQSSCGLPAIQDSRRMPTPSLKMQRRKPIGLVQAGGDARPHSSCMPRL